MSLRINSFRDLQSENREVGGSGRSGNEARSERNPSDGRREMNVHDITYDMR